MDCPSEEQMIRMKLSTFSNIHSLQFDIPKRLLHIFHKEDNMALLLSLETLGLNSTILASSEIDKAHLPLENEQEHEKQLLWKVLIINAFFFLLELVIGFVANSMGLVADSLDMLADSIVYGLALFAVGGSLIRKKNIAKMSGYLQLGLALLGFSEVIRRFWVSEKIPNFEMMMLISMFALIGNAICLYLLQKSKSSGAHIKASLIFTSNDVIVNLGVILAGALVYVSASPYPDLVIGSIVFLIVGRGAMRILQLSK